MAGQSMADKKLTPEQAAARETRHRDAAAAREAKKAQSMASREGAPRTGPMDRPAVRQPEAPRAAPETFRSSVMGGDIQMPKSLPTPAAPRAAEATGRTIAPMPDSPRPAPARVPDARQNVSAEARMPPTALPMAAPKAPAPIRRDVPRIAPTGSFAGPGAPAPMSTAVPRQDAMFAPRAPQLTGALKPVSASPDGNKFLANSQFNNLRGRG